MLEDFDKKLILGFLETNYDAFQLYLEANKIEGSEAEQICKSNLGYFAGYYDHETRMRVERLFKCSHPVFGVAKEKEITAEEAFELGKKAVK